MIRIFLDFDQTVVVGPYPIMDELVPGAIEGVKLLQEKGYKIILNTFRADIGRDKLKEAIHLLKENGIEIDDYLLTKVMPGTFSLKGLKNISHFPVTMYIDDMCPGIPKKGNGLVEYVDWERVIRAFEKEGLL